MDIATLAQAATATDWPQLTGWGAFALAALAWVSREIIPYLKDRRKADMDEKLAEENRLIKPYLDQIASLRADVSKLDGLLTTTTERHEKQFAALQSEHLDCVRNHAALEAVVNLLQGEVKSLREWRHDVVQEPHAAAMKTAADAAEGK